MPAFHEGIERPLGVSTKYGTLRHDELFKFPDGGRQAFNAVAFCFQPAQQIVQRGSHFHACGGHGILSGTFVVVNGYPLFAVGFFFQGQVIIDILYESLQTFRHGKRVAQPFLILILGEEGVGADSPVNFGGHHAL